MKKTERKILETKIEIAERDAKVEVDGVLSDARNLTEILAGKLAADPVNHDQIKVLPVAIMDTLMKLEGAENHLRCVKVLMENEARYSEE